MSKDTILNNSVMKMLRFNFLQTLHLMQFQLKLLTLRKTDFKICRISIKTFKDSENKNIGDSLYHILRYASKVITLKKNTKKNWKLI